ncbi:YcxB family protein [Kitasatospora sp. NPDC018058]|uniref:YcxB family protein n=1 Tax=Kitasatospora sp. NPDC018058 TaxID=3364025 RepID=UPI0037BEAE7D
MSIQVTYELTADQAYHGVRRANRRRFAIGRACCALLAICGIVLLVMGRWPVGAVLLVVALLLAFWQSFATRLGVARQRADNPGPLTVTFADSGCAFTTVHGRQAFAWSRFSRLAEDQDYLFLHARRELPVAVPKTAFHPAELAELMAMLQTKPNFRPS